MKIPKQYYHWTTFLVSVLAFIALHFFVALIFESGGFCLDELGNNPCEYKGEIFDRRILFALGYLIAVFFVYMNRDSLLKVPKYKIPKSH